MRTRKRACRRPIFGPALVEIYHVGSTAVPELAAKGEIDILAVIILTGAIADWTKSFGDLGYRRGGNLSPGPSFLQTRCGWCPDAQTSYLPGRPRADRQNVAFSRAPATAPGRSDEEYQELKLKLERENTGGIQEYLASKEPFISEILSLASLDPLRT